MVTPDALFTLFGTSAQKQKQKQNTYRHTSLSKYLLTVYLKMLKYTLSIFGNGTSNAEQGSSFRKLQPIFS